MPTIHLLIKGKVQGVYYRASAKEVADRLRVTGWIKNTREGHVEVLASGSEDDVRRFAAWCKRGPERAVVSEVIELGAGDGHAGAGSQAGVRGGLPRGQGGQGQAPGGQSGLQGGQEEAEGFVILR